MKINSISLISAFSMLAGMSAANAGAIADFYVGGIVGMGAQTMFADGHHETDPAPTFGAIAGIDIPFFRFEAEYDYLHSENLDTNAAMLNMYAKMPSTIVLPYIGGGVGMVFGGNHTIEDTKLDIKSTTAYQAMLGATVDVFVIPLKFDVEGRALYAPDIYKEHGISPDILQYQLRVKVRYIF